MYAVIKLAGHQHRVKKDQVILAELTGEQSGSEFDCKDVLLVGEGSGVKVGKPFVDGASVKLKIIDDVKGPKVRGFYYRKRKGTRRSWGHRQDLQKLQVVDIKGA